eukprot:2649047-Pyramimonas_sp.AAC.1
MDQSDAVSAGIFSRRTDQIIQHGDGDSSVVNTMVHSLTTDQSDAGRAGIFSRQTNRIARNDLCRGICSSARRATTRLRSCTPGHSPRCPGTPRRSPTGK